MATQNPDGPSIFVAKGPFKGLTFKKALDVVFPGVFWLSSMH